MDEGVETTKTSRRVGIIEVSQQTIFEGCRRAQITMLETSDGKRREKGARNTTGRQANSEATTGMRRRMVHGIQQTEAAPSKEPRRVPDENIDEEDDITSLKTSIGDVTMGGVSGKTGSGKAEQLGEGEGGTALGRLMENYFAYLTGPPDVKTQFNEALACYEVSGSCCCANLKSNYYRC